MSKIADYAAVARAPFLLLPVTLVAVGTAAAAYNGGVVVLHVALALVGLVALHVAVNALNEASDMKTGIDLHTTRTPFSGGSGTLPSGLLPRSAAVNVGIAGAAIGLAIGVFFVMRIGWPLMPFLILGGIGVLAYTDLLARLGIGEVFAGLGLGLLPVLGTALVQKGTIGSAAWGAGIPAFFMTFNLLLLNEFPDEDADRASGRRNLVLVLGRRTAAWIYAVVAVATPLAIVVAVATRALPTLAVVAILPFRFSVPAVHWATTRSHEPVPIPAMAGNVTWNLATNSVLAIALGLATYLGW